MNANIIYEPNRILIERGEDPPPLPSAFVNSLTEFDDFVDYPKPVFKAIREIEIGGRWTIAIPRWYSRSGLAKFFPNCEIESNWSGYNLYDKVKGVEMRVGPRDDVQKEAMDYLHGRGRFMSMKPYNQRVLALETGRGKTFAAICYFVEAGLKPIIFVHKKSLIESPWTKDIIRFTNIRKKDILVISGRESIRRAIDKGLDKCRAALCIHRTAGTMFKTDEGVKEFRRFMKAGRFGVKIYDEAHLEYRVVCTVDLEIGTYRSVYLTATPSRTTKSSRKVYRSLLPPPEKWMGVQDEYREGAYLNVIYHLIHSRPEDFYRMAMENATAVNGGIYGDYASKEGFESFWRAASQYVDAMADRGDPVAVVCGTLSLVDRVTEELLKTYPPERVGNFTGRIKNREEKNRELNKDIVVSTLKSLDAGDDSGIGGIVNMVPLSSETAITQLAGRIRRKEGGVHMFVEIVDSGFAKVHRQYLRKKSFVRRELAKSFRVFDDRAAGMDDGYG